MPTMKIIQDCDMATNQSNATWIITWFRAMMPYIANCDNDWGWLISLLQINRIFKFMSSHETDEVKSKTSHKCFQATAKSGQLSWVKSNQEVLTYDLTWIIDLDFGESFSPIIRIRKTFQYSKYNTEHDISSHFNTGLAFYWWWFHFISIQALQYDI